MLTATGEILVKPFIKWAGGKRWLVEKSSFELPSYSGRYIEPFLGSGAVFFHFQPKKAILSDLNIRLIEVYLAIRDHWSRVEAELRKLQRLHSKEYYYQERSRNRKTLHTRAAQFLYLNRTCYNGLYRENLKGQFNVPVGTKQRIILEEENFKEISDALRDCQISSCDFHSTMELATEGDLVFVVPPYTTAHNMNGFIKYNQHIFSWQDQIRLKEAISSAISRGAKVLLTNADHSSIRALYKGMGVYHSMERTTVIAGRPEYRRITTEAMYVFQ